ncbi:fimbrial protein [Herbaspirillum sp. meg3]|uniref:fimbrial protein n=1 Tax=Herbaspirillum sp. meg3 TaxID=2025949 RepID=UPI000B999E02|nr:fimbrial protein [Herbaspirillum sp. meg3]ASU37301.1 fimbrial protein [Herbaspirillum sp. meg3]
MKKTIISSLLAIAALAPVASFASDGTINFTGTVTNQTCTINGGSPNFSVTLPKVSASSLATAGAKAGQKPFTIALTACSTKSGGARALFEIGSGVNTNTGRLINTVTDNTGAKGVEIGLATANGTDILVNGVSTQPQSFVAIDANGSATLNYLAQYVATGTVPTGAGATTSSVTYSIEYQ